MKGAIKEEYELIEKEYNRNKFLFEEKVLSEKDLDANKILLIAKSRELKSLDVDIWNLKGELERLRVEISNLIQLEYDALRSSEINLPLKFERLQIAVETWLNTYLLHTPISGRISFLDAVEVGQTIQPNTVLMSVSKEESSKVARVYLPLEGAGKARVGQRVKIKLKNFPYERYGAIEGVVDKISLVPKDQKYLLTVAIPSELKTTFDEVLPESSEFYGIGEVVTENRSLLFRLFNKFEAILSRS